MDAATGPLTELAKQGPLGIVCALLVVAVIILWRRLAERETTITALQEARVQFSQTIIEKQVTAMTSTAKAMESQTEAIKELESSLRSWIMESQARRNGR